MEISRLLDVSGYVKANSYDTKSTHYVGHSGGSGGSIIINTANFTGKPSKQHIVNLKIVS